MTEIKCNNEITITIPEGYVVDKERSGERNIIVKKVERKPMFVTEDGVDMFKGNTYFFVEEGYDNINSNTIYETLLLMKNVKRFSTEKAALEYVQSLKPKCLFITEDNVEIFEEDTFWAVYSDDNKLVKYNAYKNTNVNFPNIKTFAIKGNALDFILMNKPVLSLNDLLSVWKADKDFDVVNNSPLFARFKELAQSKNK